MHFFDSNVAQWGYDLLGQAIFSGALGLL